MDILLKEDKKYIFNAKSCYFKAEIDKSYFFTNPKAAFVFDDGSTITCIFSLLTGTYTWSGGSIKNGDLKYLGSAWVLSNYTSD